MRFFCYFILFTSSYFAQEVKAPKDSLELKYHQKSMLASAVVPGLGQIRNSNDGLNFQAVWKVPLIYGGLGAASYFLISNQQTQKSLKQEYTNRLSGGMLNPSWASYDDQAVLQLYRQYLDWRDLSILGFAAIYLFQIAEAGASAHFVHFDTHPNLSLQIEPQVLPNQYVGARIQLTFR